MMEPRKPVDAIVPPLDNQVLQRVTLSKNTTARNRGTMVLEESMRNETTGRKDPPLESTLLSAVHVKSIR